MKEGILNSDFFILNSDGSLSSMPLYLGLDSSTQSLSAIVLEIDADRRRVVFEESMSFDEAISGVRHGAWRAAGARIRLWRCRRLSCGQRHSTR